MDPVSNPYTPNAGATPQAIVGRDDQLESFDLLLRRSSIGRTEQSMIVTGLRGVGKTVLLGQFRGTALRTDWVVIELEVRKHDDNLFRREITGLTRTALFELSPKAKWDSRLERAARVLTSFAISVDPSGALTARLDVDALEGIADHLDLAQDLTDLLVAVGEAAQSKDRGVVLLFDEVQFLSPSQLEALISAIHKTVQRELPIILVAAGLPQIAELAGDAKSYAERLFKFFRIGNLSPDDARTAFSSPAGDEGVTWHDDALDLAIEVTEGYPYFIQELGSAIWPIADDDLIRRVDVEAALPIYESKLDSSFFRVRLDRSTDLQRAYLRAMAELGPAPQKAAAVAELLDRTSTQCGPVRAELIAMGLLFTPEHGFAAFTVPQFDKFLLRAMPTLEVPAKKVNKK
ncbi:MAG: ATP-binding protein [Nocardioides sp.]